MESSFIEVLDPGRLRDLCGELPGDRRRDLRLEMIEKRMKRAAKVP